MLESVKKAVPAKNSERISILRKKYSVHLRYVLREDIIGQNPIKKLN